MKRLFKVLLLCSTYNSMTQRFYAELSYLGHEVSCIIASSKEAMQEVESTLNFIRPEVIIAPFLKIAIPKSIWEKFRCLIVHPGIKGDRGASSLDWAILNNWSNWGVTILEASEEWDAGNIWAFESFKIEGESKSILYREKCAQAAIKATVKALEHLATEGYQPEPLNYSRPDVKGSWNPLMKQSVRRIDWQNDSTEVIVRKIRCSDSQPGVLDDLGLDVGDFYLYGAHPESMFVGTKPREIIGQRYGAICLSTVDGAVWVSHLRRKDSFKLPAMLVLKPLIAKSILENIHEISAPTSFSEWETFREIWYEEKNGVGYLHFDFYNGAMGTEQCNRLREEYLNARVRDTKVIVLMGGNFFSNGIHLNLIEAASDPRLESWRNINAMNDLILEILRTDDHLTIAALQGNAAAGGVMLALACDQVFARNGVVLNPHYKKMGLFGSEYWTYSLPRRVGVEMATQLTQACQPIIASEAVSINLINNCFGETTAEFRELVVQRAEEMARDNFDDSLRIKNHRRFLDEQYRGSLQEYRERELDQMKIDFASFAYNIGRNNFVYKKGQPCTSFLINSKRRELGRDLVSIGI